MANPTNIYKIEQINVSDTDYKLTGIYKKSGDIVTNGEMIFTYESSKADFDVYAAADGYIYYPEGIHTGTIMRVGEIVAVTNTTPIAAGDVSSFFAVGSAPPAAVGERIVTKKARALMSANNIDESDISGYSIINEDVINEYLKKTNKANNYQNIDFYYTEACKTHFCHGLKRLAVVGAGKAALQLYDTVLAEKKYQIVFLYDNNEQLSGKALAGIPIRGTINYEQIRQDFKDGLFDEIIVSFSGDIAARKKTFGELSALKIPIANIIHPSCTISNFVNIGSGNILFANVRIGPFVEVGDNNVLSSMCSIEHHNFLGSHNTFGPAVVTSGSCKIEDGNKFGTGIYVEPKITIGSDCVISSGVVIRQNIRSGCVVRNLSKIEIKPIQ